MTPKLTPKDVQVRLSCSRATVYRLFATGAIRHVRIGTRVKTCEAWIEEYLKSVTAGGVIAAVVVARPAHPDA